NGLFCRRFRAARSHVAVRQIQHAARLHYRDGLLERTHDQVDVGVAVRRCKEARKTLEKMNAFLAQVVVEEASEAEIRREAEIENTGEMFDARRNAVTLEQIVQALHQAGGSFAKLL